MSMLIAGVVGFTVGLLVAIVAMVLVMRSSMVVPEPSTKSFDATCAALERVVPRAEGWSFPMDSLDMGAKLAAKNALPASIRTIRVYFMCNPAIAEKVLGARPQLAAIMPCSWAVYELADSSVWVSHMNIAMMSKMMGGVVGTSMATVADVDRRLLAEVLG